MSAIESGRQIERQGHDVFDAGYNILRHVNSPKVMMRLTAP